MTEQEYLQNYDKNAYEKPSVATDLVILTVGDIKEKEVRKKDEKQLEIILEKRTEYPEKDKWGLIGGFMGMEEELDETVSRKLLLATGMENVYAEQLYTFSEVNRDSRMRVLSASYLSLVNKNQIKLKENTNLFKVILKETSINEGEKEIELTLQNENISLKSILKVTSKKVGKISKSKIEIVESPLVFDHAKIILYSILRLKNKIEYTSLVYNLMDEEFTIPNLKLVFETILGYELNNMTFRSKVINRLEYTGKSIKEGAYRPSKLYRFKENTEEEFQF